MARNAARLRMINAIPAGALAVGETERLSSGRGPTWRAPGYGQRALRAETPQLREEWLNSGEHFPLSRPAWRRRGRRKARIVERSGRQAKKHLHYVRARDRGKPRSPRRNHRLGSSLGMILGLLLFPPAGLSRS